MSDHIFKDAIERVKRIGSQADVSLDVINSLMHPHATLTASLPVRMDNGSTQYFTGYRCRYNNLLGPSKGGIRYHPNVNRQGVEALALWMTIKCAIVGLPYAGGNGGITVDAKKLSAMEIERLSRAYVRAMADFIGPDTDIPAPDVYTNARIMGWMMDEYETIKRVKAPGVITGKAISLGVSLGRDNATGRGAYLCIKQLESKNKWQPNNITVAVQGFGNGGYHVARLLHDDGYKIVAISDSQGGIYSDNGFDVDSIYKGKQETNRITALYCKHSVCELVDHDVITNEQLLELDVDILIPAALDGVITTKNVNNIKAKNIVEVANGPIIGEVDHIIAQKGITVIPDVLANAGGVTVSYFEWVQNKNGYYWSLPEVHNKLATIMNQAFSEIWDISMNEKVTMRDAAYMLAMRRFDKALSAHGTQHYFSN
jgi:glutamate dehydrogenase (NADP+)